MAAIPDFRVEAMDNWGLILYRETEILYDPQETSSSSKQWVAIVVAHELAHQVFNSSSQLKTYSYHFLVKSG